MEGGHYFVTRDEFAKYTSNTEGANRGRIYRDAESGLVAYLPQSTNNDMIVSENNRETWRQSKRAEREAACFAKDTSLCPVLCVACPIRNNCISTYKEKDAVRCVIKCEFCNFTHKSRVDRIGILSEGQTSDEYQVERDLPGDTDIESEVERKVIGEAMLLALELLKDDDRALVSDIFYHEKTERELAPKYDLKQGKSINKRKQRILALLRRDTVLKSYFE